MGANKLVLTAAAVSMLLWMATPVMAGHGHGKGNAFGLADAGKRSGGHHFGTTDKPHSNKHGKDRGLDRADDVAGEHGQQGRANADIHQADDHSGSDSE
jgi:hypothetical protein